VQNVQNQFFHSAACWLQPNFDGARAGTNQLIFSSVLMVPEKFFEPREGIAG
jgi:hypothetical protein